MSSFKIEFTGAALRDLKKTGKQVKERIISAIDGMKENPWEHDFRKIQEKSGEWRLRVGTWRIIFEPDWEHRILYVKRIKTRAKAYKQKS